MATVENEPDGEAEGDAEKAPEVAEIRVLGWLLLPNGDAVPLTGFTPEALRASVDDVVPTDGEVRDAEEVLDEIVWALGFDGGFAGYLDEGWPRLRAVMQARGATAWTDMFDLPFNTIYFHLKRRDLADRIFFGPSPPPSRAFTGHGHDWSRWDRVRRSTVQWRPDADDYEPVDLDDAADWVHRHCDHLNTAFPLFGDLLFEPERPDCLPLQTYFPGRSALAQRQETYDRARKVAAVFRWCIDRLPGGWVDVVRVTDSLALLIGDDGGFEVLWRDFRRGQPLASDAQRLWDMTARDLPASLRADLEFTRWHASRPGVWEQFESHQAEMLHYANGGGTGYDYPGSLVIRERLLRARGQYGPPRGRAVIPRHVDGFVAVRMPNRRLILASELVSIAAFQMFSEASGYGARRGGEPLGPANDGDKPALPVAVTRADALAYIAWLERSIGLPLRLMTYAEHRALRPKGDRAQAFDGEMGELGPPKRLGEALEWSMPRYERYEVPEGRRPLRRWAHGRSGPLDGEDSGPTYRWRRVWIPQEDWPPAVKWREPIPWKVYGGLHFIDAWDAFEWCFDGRVLGIYWEGAIGETSWGEYKSMKVCFRVVVDGTPGE